MKKQKSKKVNNGPINLDNEIIIGLTPKKDERTKKKTKAPNKSNTKQKQKTVKKVTKKNNIKPKKKKANTKKDSEKKSIKSKLIKWTILLVLLALCIILFLLSSVFNIKSIIVTNNSKLTKEEVVSLSGLQLNENMFKTVNSKIKGKIETNPYVENVKIKKSLNGTITLEIKERVATYMLTYANAYVYINNQGYILELSDAPLELPTIIGFTTSQEEIKEGNRLAKEDLEKLDTIIKIISAAKSKEIDVLITEIDTTNTQDYILKISSELKTVHFGDISNINEKIMWIQKIIDKKKSIEGEIFVNNLEKSVYFGAKI